MNERTNAEHKFTSMEEFLIDFCDERSKSRHYLYDLKLRDYFQEHPLTEENYEKIKAFLKEHRKDYDVICMRYGIETEKLSCEEYAAKNNSRKKSKAEWLYRQTTKWDTNGELTQKLYYMAIQPKHLRQYVFDAQYELRNMMKAYDELTGKNTVSGHHVGMCDFSLGRALFKEGFDTLEEIQKCDPEKFPWRGVVYPILGVPPFDENPVISIIEDYGEVKIFFKTKAIGVDVETMREVLNSLVYKGNCSGYDIRRILCGDIWVHFNPTYHGAFDRRHVIEKVVEELRRVAINVDGYEDDSELL